MFSRLSSAFSSIKEKVSSLAGKAKDALASYLPASVDPRPAVRERVMQTLQNPPAPVSKFSQIRLDMPEIRSGSIAREPTRGTTTKGMFGVEFWPKQANIPVDNPYSVFQDFQRQGRMDETPLTDMFYDQVRQRAVARGDLDYDPLANMNRESLAAPVAPALSRLTRVSEVQAQAAPAREAKIYQFPVAPARAQKPRSIADDWLMSPTKSLREISSGVRSRVDAVDRGALRLAA